jgi:hypothetical protein
MLVAKYKITFSHLLQFKEKELAVYSVYLLLFVKAVYFYDKQKSIFQIY